MSVSAAERMRDLKRSMPQIISQPQGISSSLFTQERRYASATNSVNSSRGGQGQVVQQSAETLLAARGNVSVCCPTGLITVPTETASGAGWCAVLSSAPPPLPHGFYEPPRPPCPPVNNPPLAPWVPRGKRGARGQLRPLGECC